MNATGVRFEVLNKDNFDTWKIQMRAVLIKNDMWSYVNGTKVKPEPVAGADSAAITATRKEQERWVEADLKAQSDIVLAINPSEIKQIKGCDTSRKIWLKLEEIYQSKGPARKATLLNQLISTKAKDGDDVREHIRKFFDIVDKLSELEVDIHQDLLSVMLLRSLPENFENLRCAVASRDELPNPESLRIKIAEEFDARKGGDRSAAQNAMAVKWPANKNRQKSENQHEKSEKPDANRDKRTKCHNCGVIGHRARNCRKPRKSSGQFSGKTGEEYVSLYSSTATPASEIYCTDRTANRDTWCIDSGCTSHMCGDKGAFSTISAAIHEKLNLASSAQTEIKGIGLVKSVVKVDDSVKAIGLQDTLYVPDLRTNLLSVGKIADKGYAVIFMKDDAAVVSGGGDVVLRARRENGLYYFQGETAVESVKMVKSIKPSEGQPTRLARPSRPP